MFKRVLSALLAALMLFTLLPTAFAYYNDSEMNWDEHTTHVYDNCDDVTCNVCSEVRTPVAHTYDNDCDATCNACDHTREVGDHQRNTPACQDGTCSICGVAMPATTICVSGARHACQDGTCITCGKVMYATEAHTVDNGDDTVCNVCGGEVIPCDHEYDNACDDTCNKNCGYVRPVNPHEYTILNQNDENGHWHECACGAKTAAEPHTYIIQLKDEKQHWRVCDACSREEAGSRFDHQFTITELDDENHWKRCECWQIDPSSRSAHEYDNACDGDCDECGLTRPVGDHVYTDACDVDCNECGVTREVGEHTWKSGKCSVCGIASPTKVTITTQPKTSYGKDGATVKLTVKASGEGLKYAWYYKNSGKTGYSKASDTSASYSIKMSSTTHNRSVYVIVTDKYGNKVQSSAVTVRRQVTITKTNATAVYAQSGKKASVKITAVGDNLKYTWYVKNSGASKFGKSSVKTATYSATMSSSVKGRQVYCVVTDKYGKSVQSKTVTLRMAATITKANATTVYAQSGKKASVKVTATGDGLKYAWYYKNSGSKKFTKASVTSATYTATMGS